MKPFVIYMLSVFLVATVVVCKNKYVVALAALALLIGMMKLEHILP